MKFDEIQSRFADYSRVGYVPYIYPLDAKDTLPLVLSPDSRSLVVIDRRRHLGDTAEMAAERK